MGELVKDLEEAARGAHWSDALLWERAAQRIKKLTRFNKELEIENEELKRDKENLIKMIEEVKKDNE